MEPTPIPDFGTAANSNSAGGDDTRQQLLRLLGEGACRQLGLFPVPADLRLSVVIPIYNEENTLAEIIRRIRAVPLPKEMILIDDCSTDGTRALLRTMEGDSDLRIVYHEKNLGKGGRHPHGLRSCFRKHRPDPGRGLGV